MKKSTIKLIAMLLTVVLMLPNFAGAGALNENEVDDGLLTWEEVEEIGRLEAPATDAYDEMINSWVDESNTVIYPSTYGGSYLRDDYKLVIKLVNGDSVLREQILAAVSNPSVLVFVDTDISRAELYDLATQIEFPEGVFPCYSTVSYELSAIRAVVDKNSVVAMPYSAVQPHVIFEPAEPLVRQYGDCPPGDIFTAKVDGKTDVGSVGWHGKYQFQNTSSSSRCILTAGHVISEMKGHNVVSSDKATIIISDDNFKTNSYYYNSLEHSTGTTIHPTMGTPMENYDGDYGFIRTSSVTLTNKVITGATAGSIAMSMPNTPTNYENLEGMTVYKSKGNSSYRSGKLLSSQFTYNIEQSEHDVGIAYKVNGLLAISPVNPAGRFSEPGDSGTPVFYYKGGTYYVLGIVSNGPRESKPGEPPVTGDSLITGINLILDAGFIPYPYN